MIDSKAFHSLSYGLYVVTAVDSDGRLVGCVANSFQQVTSTPPMVSVSLNKENATTKAILATGEYGITVLSTDADMELIGCFGFQTSADTDKYQNVDYSKCSLGLPYLMEASVARFSVKVTQTVDLPTHIMFIGDVVEAEPISDATPLTYDYYHNVIKGKTPPKAVSYIAEENPSNEKAPEPSSDGRIGWRCTLCGYIVEMEELPDDFTCPICGVGKEFFEKVTLD